jgi:hypothetical protein
MGFDAEAEISRNEDLSGAAVLRRRDGFAGGAGMFRAARG